MRSDISSETGSSRQPDRLPWNKGRLMGQKQPFQLKHVWAIRTTLKLNARVRDLALFNLAIDSKLRGCDLVTLRIADIAPGGFVAKRATIRQLKTGRPVTFEITEQARLALDSYMTLKAGNADHYLFPGGNETASHLGTRQYARLVRIWVELIGLDSSLYGTHSLRRTKATLIYRKTGNLRAVQLLLGHSKIESTVRYLGIEVDDALAIAEQVDV